MSSFFPHFCIFSDFLEYASKPYIKNPYFCVDDNLEDQIGHQHIINHTSYNTIIGEYHLQAVRVTKNNVQFIFDTPHGYCPLTKCCLQLLRAHTLILIRRASYNNPKSIKERLLGNAIYKSTFEGGWVAIKG